MGRFPHEIGPNHRSEPLELPMTNRRELAQYLLEIPIAVPTGNRDRNGIDLRPIGSWRLQEETQPSSEIVEVFVDEVADDLQDRPIPLGRSPSRVLLGTAQEQRCQRRRKSIETIHHPRDIHVWI